MTIVIVTDGDFENGTELVIDDELLLHAEDDRVYSATRGHQLKHNLTWNELTDEERRAAREACAQLD